MESRPLWGTDTNYEVFEDGTVVSHKRNKRTVMKRQKWNTGYQFIKVNGEIHSVHAIVYYSFAGTRPLKRSSGLCINHKDGDKTNNALSNLEQITTKANIFHRDHTLGCKLTGLNSPQETTVIIQATGEIIAFRSRRLMNRCLLPQQISWKPGK